MRKYFEYLSGKPQKFFTVNRMCTKIFTIEGKLGSKGKLDEKNYVSEEVAISIYEKLITEKLAEGYVEGDEDNPTLPEPTKKKASSSKAKSKAPTEAWHKNSYWHYGTYDNKVLADLTKDAERKKKASRSRYNDDDEDLTPYDKTSPDWDENFPEERETLQYKFEKACRIQNIAWIEKYLKEGANINSKVGYDQLSTLAALIDDSHFGKGDTIEVLKYLIKQGVDYNDETIDETIEDESAQIFGECISAFRKNPDINKMDALFDSILQPIWDKLADEIIEYIRKILTTYHEVGEKYFEMRIKTSVYKNEVSFIFYTNEGNQTTVNTVTGEKFEFTTELPIKGLSATCGFNNLFHRLEKPLLKIKEEGLFNIIALSEFSVGMEDAYEVVHPFFTVVNEEKRKVEKEDFEQKLKRLETKEEWEPWTDGIEVAHILFNGKGLIESDETRAMNILKGMLFSTRNKEHRRAWYTLLDTADKSYGGEAYYNLVMYCLADKGSFDSWSTERLEKSANLGYEPAIKLLAEENAKNTKPKSDKLLPFDKRFTPEELFLETDLLSIRASEEEGYVRLAFKTESEEAYSLALDFINNLLRKEYAYHFDGYQLMVKFIEEPILGIPSFPNTPVNAFFGKAVSYINLRPKVAEYATLGFARGGQYLEINGSEVNTVVGSFAAGALAIADIKYLYLLDEYVSNVDGEHECVQLELIEELNDAHGGITPEMVPTIVDLATSYDQPGYYGTPEVLYTNPQNLKAILHHFLTSKKYQRSPGDSLVMFVESRLLYKTPKNNLRKIAELAGHANNEAEKLIYVKFYNTYKNYAELYHSEDYGEDMGAVARKNDFFTGYTESVPVTIGFAEAIEKGYTFDESNDYTKSKNTFIYFHAYAFSDPKIKLLLNRQWEKAKTSKYTDTVIHGKEPIVYDEWYINMEAMPCDYGIIHLRENEKPIIYYGGLDTVALAHATATKPPKDENARLKIQEKYSVMEVPPVITDKDKRRETLLYNLFAALYDYSKYEILRVAELVTPEDGPFYTTALMYAIDLLAERGDIEKARLYCESLVETEPAYKDYWLTEAKKYQ